MGFPSGPDGWDSVYSHFISMRVQAYQEIPVTITIESIFQWVTNFNLPPFDAAMNVRMHNLRIEAEATAQTWIDGIVGRNDITAVTLRNGYSGILAEAFNAEADVIAYAEALYLASNP